MQILIEKPSQKSITGLDADDPDITITHRFTIEQEHNLVVALTDFINQLINDEEQEENN